MDKVSPKADVFQANRDRAAPLLKQLKADGIGHMIGGEIVPSSSGETFDTASPIDRTVLAPVARGNANIERLKKDRSAFKDAVLSAVPSTLFVLVPVFALMLKLAYLLRRRLYMEHVVVALHSHAFLCLDLLLVFGVIALDRVVAPDGFADGMLRLAEVLLFGWMALYLLIMQKRVYRQGWIMTLLKYCALGSCYFVLLGIGIGLTALLSLVWM